MAAYFDIAWRIAAWVLVAVGAAVVLRAVVWDAVRLLGRRHRAGLRRCPGGWGRVLWVVPCWRGCWYDLSGVGAEGSGRAVCPECGRAQGGWRLKMPRVRWGLAGLGLAVVGVGLAGRYGREVYRQGWAAVPTWALVLVPFNERDLIEGGAVDGPEWVQRVAKEIDERGPFDGWAGDRWAARVEARYRRDGMAGVDEASREAFGRLEGTAISEWSERTTVVEAVRFVCEEAGVGWRVDEEALRAAGADPELVVDLPAIPMSAEQALDVIARLADDAYVGIDWTLRGGLVEFATTDATYTPTFYQVIRLPDAALQIRMVWVDEHANFSGRYQAGWYPAVPYNERAGGLADLAMLTVHPDEWAYMGGVHSSCVLTGTGLLIGSSVRDLLMVERFLEVFQAARGLEPGRPGFVVDATQSSSRVAEPTVTVVHGVAWLRAAHDALRGAFPEVRPIDEYHEMLAEVLTVACDPDAWTVNGGDAAECMSLLDRLIVNAPARMQGPVAAIVDAVRAANESAEQSVDVVPGVSIYPAFDSGWASRDWEWEGWLRIEFESVVGQYDAWGAPPTVEVIGNAVIVFGTPDHQRAAQSLLAQLRERFDSAQ